MNLETQFKQTLKKIKLSKKEKIVVAFSGGKDSAVTGYLLKKFGYNIEGIYIDLKVGRYSDECLKAVKKLCDDLGIQLYVYDLKKEQGKTMKYFWSKNKKLNHCSVCGVMKKWVLNKEAQRLGAEKIATGHHLNDEAETFLMNFLKGSPELSANTGSITMNISDKKFVPRIKPLFYISEEEIKKYVNAKKLPFVEGVCPYREDSYRVQVRKFLNTLPKKQTENIIKNLEKIRSRIKKKSREMNYCNICKEPCRKSVCKKCEMMK